MRFKTVLLVFVGLLSLRVMAVQPPAQRAAHVIVITMDGMRWQEVFGGADRAYFEKTKDGTPTDAEKRFWRRTAQERRTTLMPFLWQSVAVNGQVFGDPEKNSRAHVTNGLWFSYPGYNEMFSGAADPRIDSNDKVPNPNLTVLEWLNQRPAFRGRVAAFGSWDVLPFILNVTRSGIPVGSGFAPVPSPGSDQQRAIDQLATDLPPYFGYGPFDAPIVYAALDCLRTKKPRVLYVMLAETDEWAHQGKYDLYLDAAHRSDDFMRRIWEAAQAMPEYADQTTLILTTDHGRGATLADWQDHGRKVPAAENTWIGLVGAGVQPLGVREGVTVTTSQIAATIAATLGEDFTHAKQDVAPPLIPASSSAVAPVTPPRDGPDAQADRVHITGVAHVRLMTSDLEAARRFYGRVLGFPEITQPDTGVAVFRVNNRQRLILQSGLPPEEQDRLVHVAFETPDLALTTAIAKRDGLAAASVDDQAQGGGQAIETHDPDGHRVRLVQSSPSSNAVAIGADDRISRRILHIGLTVRDPAAADRFYRDFLGFSEIWRGGANEGMTSWINMRVPDGTDYLEYMLTSAPPDRRQLGSAHHIALLVPSIQDALEFVRARTAPGDPNHRAIPQIGRNRKWQLNVFDPDGTRIEFMEPWPMR